MKTNTTAQHQRNIDTLDKFEALESKIEAQLNILKELDPSSLAGLLPKVLMGKANPLELLGLDPKLFDNIELLTKFNRAVRAEHRAQLVSHMNEADLIEDAEVTHGENTESE